ncbi:MAG: SulP family inorganic anion transporter, partial [Granulosicoccaceae bacterium]
CEHCGLWPDESMTRWKNLLPFLLWWPLVNRKSLRADIIAGLTNAVIVLPQGVAFAIIAGLPPEYGLYTAMVTPVIAALFGSSWHLISGPTTAISIVVFATVSGVAEPGTPEYISAVLTLTFLAGLYQLVFGLARMGSLVNFVSHTVVVGFTTGAAVLILTSQMRVVLGLDLERADFVHTWWQIGLAWRDINPIVLAIAAATAATAVTIKWINSKAPHLLIALLVGSALTWLLDGQAHGVQLLGALPSHLPPPSIPDLTLANVRELSTSALAVAILGLIEAVSISRSIAVKSRQRINGNQEFIGQGLSNMVGSFFSAYAGSGSFTRSGVNYDAGARTPLSAIFAAVALALLVLFVAPLTRYLPIPAMGGVIVIVAWGLVNLPEIKKIISAGAHEWSVLVATFASTLFVELEFAVYGGVLLSLLLYLNRTSKPKVLSLAPNPNAPKRRIEDADKLHLPQCPQMKMSSIDGSLFFGAIDHVETQLDKIRRANPRQKHLMVLCEGVNFIDLAGAELLEREAETRAKMGGSIALVGLKEKTIKDLERFGVLDHLGEDNIMDSKTYALRDISARFEPELCQRCTVKIFRECEMLSKKPEEKAAELGSPASPLEDTKKPG